jgi:hypothetical protein
MKGKITHTYSILTYRFKSISQVEKTVVTATGGGDE